MRVLFIGTPGFAAASLSALLDAGHQVPAVVTRPDAKAGRGLRPKPSAVKSLALTRGIPVLQPVAIRSAAFREELKALQCDLCVVAAFGRILPDEILNVPRLGSINVHASLLPRYRGAAPVARAILEGETTTGVTLMRMVAALDAGPMLASRSTPIGELETAGELEARLAVLGADLLVELLEPLARGEIREQPQEEASITWAPPLRKEEGAIRWADAAGRIAHQVRAFNPWPGAWGQLPAPGAARLSIWRARAGMDQTPPAGAHPGQVLEASAAPPGRIAIACGTGVLWIEELQPEGKRRMSASAAVSGRYLKIGDVLGDG